MPKERYWRRASIEAMIPVDAVYDEELVLDRVVEVVYPPSVMENIGVRLFFRRPDEPQTPVKDA